MAILGHFRHFSTINRENFGAARLFFCLCTVFSQFLDHARKFPPIFLSQKQGSATRRKCVGGGRIRDIWPEYIPLTGRQLVFDSLNIRTDLHSVSTEPPLWTINEPK